MPQAMDRLFATPMIRPRLPRMTPADSAMTLLVSDARQPLGHLPTKARRDLPPRWGKCIQMCRPVFRFAGAHPRPYDIGFPCLQAGQAQRRRAECAICDGSIRNSVAILVFDIAR